MYRGVAVFNLTELEDGTFYDIFYFNIEPSINIGLLPSLNDGHLLTLSFDMLLDMFSGFSVSVQICHSVTKVSLNVAGVTLSTYKGRRQ